MLGHTHPSLILLSLDKESGPSHRKTLNMPVSIHNLHKNI